MQYGKNAGGFPVWDKGSPPNTEYNEQYSKEVQKMPRNRKPVEDEQKFVAAVDVPPAKGKKVRPDTTAFHSGAKTVGREFTNPENKGNR
jgi:hypothetical protein